MGYSLLYLVMSHPLGCRALSTIYLCLYRARLDDAWPVSGERKPVSLLNAVRKLVSTFVDDEPVQSFFGPVRLLFVDGLNPVQMSSRSTNGRSLLRSSLWDLTPAVLKSELTSTCTPGELAMDSLKSCDHAIGVLSRAERSDAHAACGNGILGRKTAQQRSSLQGSCPWGLTRTSLASQKPWPQSTSGKEPQF